MKKLTEKQEQVLEYIRSKHADNIFPSLAEIAAHFKVGVSTVHSHLAALERKEIIRRSGRARSIVINGELLPRDRHCVMLPVLDDPNGKQSHTGERVFVDEMFAKRYPNVVRMQALHVPDDGMRPLGIFRGDIAIIGRLSSRSRIPFGEVVLLRNSEAGLLLRLCCRSHDIPQPTFCADPGRERPAVLPGETVIIGMVLSIIRRY